MGKVGFINPNIFSERNLEYRIRFSKAPLLVETMRQLQKEQSVNSYLVRGDYDVVLVSVESDHFLFKALLDKRIEELKLQDTTIFTVGQFLKYHGCMVTPIRGKQDSSAYSSEILHYLFNLSKDWQSASESYKKKLLEMNLLMVNTFGMTYEEEPLQVGEGQGIGRQTIIRLGFDGVISDAMHGGFQQHIKSEIIKSPIVRNCYAVKSPVPCRYILEVVGDPKSIDDFVIHLHEECEAKFPSLRLFARCDDVMRKLSDGHWNVLLTIQTKPELLSLAEEKLVAPIFSLEQGEQAEIIHFIEKCETVIRSMGEEPLRRMCIEMLSEIQLALQLNSYSLLRDAVNSIGQQLVTLMISKLSGFYHCDDNVEAVIGELKVRGMFREHTATFGNLYPVFVGECCSLIQGNSPDTTSGKKVFERFNEYRNTLIFSKRTESLTGTEREQAKSLFWELVGILPKYFEEVADAG